MIRYISLHPFHHNHHTHYTNIDRIYTVLWIGKQASCFGAWMDLQKTWGGDWLRFSLYNKSCEGLINQNDSPFIRPSFKLIKKYVLSLDSFISQYFLKSLIFTIFIMKTIKKPSISFSIDIAMIIPFHFGLIINQNQIKYYKMIKRLITLSHPTFLPTFLLHNNLKYNNSTEIKILRQSDELSLSQIDQILGNEPSDLQINKKKQELVKKQYFYGLVPLKNQHFPPCIDPDHYDLLQTPNRNIMEALKIDVQSSFKDYCTNMSTFWREDQLYGSITPQTQIEAKTLEFYPVLTPESKYLQRMRGQFIVNLSIPGTIEAQDARNFLQLRPVQQFRHTPIVPIPQSTMKRHKQKLQEYHRRQFILQISKESIFNFVLFTTAAGICFYMIYILLEKEEERTVAYTRLKYNRKMGIQESPTFRI